MHARRRLQYQPLLLGQGDIPIDILHNHTPVSARGLNSALIALVHSLHVRRDFAMHVYTLSRALTEREKHGQADTPTARTQSEAEAEGEHPHLGTIDSSPVCMNSTCFCAYLYSKVRLVHAAVHGIVQLPHIV